MTRGSNFGMEAEFFGISRPQAVRALEGEGLSARDMDYSHETTSWWKLVSDSSVHNNSGGNELVSPILSMGRPGFKATADALGAIRRAGADVDVSCGLHIHHNARGMSPRDIMRACGTYTLFQKAILECLPSSRAQGEYTKPADEDWLTSVVKLYASGFTGRYRNRYVLSDRFVAVNLAAIEMHGTIEFRQHSATLNPTKVEHWARLTHAIMHTLKNPWEAAEKYGQSLSDVGQQLTIEDAVQHLQLSDSDLEYWRARRKLFHGTTGRLPRDAEGDEEDRKCNTEDYGSSRDYDGFFNVCPDDDSDQWEDCAQCNFTRAYHMFCGQCHANLCYLDGQPPCDE